MSSPFKLEYIHTDSYYGLYSQEHTGILVPTEQRVLAALSLGLLDIRRPAHELLVRQNLRELSGEGLVHGLRYPEVSREHDVKLSLVYLSCVSQNFRCQELESYPGCADGYGPSLISCLHDR